MQPASDQPQHDFIAAISRGLIALFSHRAEPGERSSFYEQTMAFCVMAFQPRDMPELTAANHCLRFHYVLDDAVDDMLHEADRLVRRKLRPDVNATGRICFSHNREYHRLRRRKPEEIVAPLSAAFATPTAPAASAGDAAARPQASSQARGAGGGFVPSQAEILAASKLMASRFPLPTAKTADGAAKAMAEAAKTASGAPKATVAAETATAEAAKTASGAPKATAAAAETAGAAKTATGAAAANADPASAGLPRGDRHMSPPAMPEAAMPEAWAVPTAPALDAAAARILPQQIASTTTPSPIPPAIRAVPDPALAPKPMNRAQRRLAVKLERTKARRAAAANTRVSAKVRAGGPA